MTDPVLVACRYAADMQPIYLVLEELVDNVLMSEPETGVPTYATVLDALARDLAANLLHELDHEPRLMTQDRGWVIKKAHEVLGRALDEAIQQPFNGRLGMPRDYRG